MMPNLFISHPRRIFYSNGVWFLRTLLTVLMLSSCSYSSAQYDESLSTQAPQPPPTQIFFYPNKGQDATQQDRDRYECYLWAVKQTGFDPSMPQLAPHQKVEVLPRPPAGHDTALGAITGAVLGAIVSSPHNAAEGAAIGAVAGAVFGAASDSARQEQAQRLQDQYNRQEIRKAARIEKQAQNYRRAMAACLEGRDYTVSSAW